MNSRALAIADHTRVSRFATPTMLFGLAPILFGGLWISLHQGVENPLISGLAGYVLAQLLAVAVLTDLHSRRIPNWATYTAFLWGLAINTMAALTSQSATWLGAVGLQQSVIGGFGMLIIMFVMFSLSGGGAGDVKLTAALGALLGWNVALDALLYSFIVAGAGLLIYAIWVYGPVSILVAVGRGIGHRLMPLAIAPPPESQQQLLTQKFPLAPFFAAGTVIALYIGR